MRCSDAEAWRKVKLFLSGCLCLKVSCRFKSESRSIRAMVWGGSWPFCLGPVGFHLSRVRFGTEFASVMTIAFPGSLVVSHSFLYCVIKLRVFRATSLCIF